MHIQKVEELQKYFQTFLLKKIWDCKPDKGCNSRNVEWFSKVPSKFQSFCICEIKKVAKIKKFFLFAGSRDLARAHPVCLLDRQFPEKFPLRQSKMYMVHWRILNFVYFFITNWSKNCPPWHKRLVNVVGIGIWRSWVAKSGWAEILWMLFWTGIFEILVKTQHGRDLNSGLPGKACLLFWGGI